jgi:hypothetical protein
MPLEDLLTRYKETFTGKEEELHVRDVATAGRRLSDKT